MQNNKRADRKTMIPGKAWRSPYGSRYPIVFPRAIPATPASRGLATVTGRSTGRRNIPATPARLAVDDHKTAVNAVAGSAGHGNGFCVGVHR